MTEPGLAPRSHRTPEDGDELPSWVVGVCGVAAVASALFSILMLLNR